MYGHLCSASYEVAKLRMDVSRGPKSSGKVEVVFLVVEVAARLQLGSPSTARFWTEPNGMNRCRRQYEPVRSPARTDVNWREQ